MGPANLKQEGEVWGHLKLLSLGWMSLRFPHLGAELVSEELWRVWVIRQLARSRNDLKMCSWGLCFRTSSHPSTDESRRCSPLFESVESQNIGTILMNCALSRCLEREPQRSQLQQGYSWEACLTSWTESQRLAEAQNNVIALSPELRAHFYTQLKSALLPWLTDIMIMVKRGGVVTATWIAPDTSLWVR